MASLYLAKWEQLSADDGTPLAGGKLNWTITTTTTAKNTYPTEADAEAGTNANVNPVVLDADGRSPVAIWITGRYRLRTYTSADVLIADDDPIVEGSSAAAAQSSSASYGGNNSGSANALAFTYSPAITSYTNGAVLRGRILADNTGAVTINAGGGVKSLVKRDGAALVAGDLQGPEIITFSYDSTTDVFRLLNPTAVSLSNIRTYTASDTWTKPGNIAYVIVHANAGGGAGGGAASTTAGQMSATGGGGGGEYARAKIAASALGATEAVTIGAGGVGASGAQGGDGADSSFGTLVVARGGKGGLSMAAGSTAITAAGGQGGGILATGTGDVLMQGQAGGTGERIDGDDCEHGVGGASPGPYGGTQATASTGSAQVSNVSRGLASGQVVGEVGHKYGGGASGQTNAASATVQTGKAGSPGIVVVEEYIYS